ncbi:hypothetical protein BN3661_01020 [Eubacteriaceae bacterium CHKCI005]|nr:hypothetical protein BN3661_01020 [Eubacteriaceae bacterium CHKCI005]
MVGHSYKLLASGNWGGIGSILVILIAAETVFFLGVLGGQDSDVSREALILILIAGLFIHAVHQNKLYILSRQYRQLQILGNGCQFAHGTFGELSGDLSVLYLDKVKPQGILQSAIGQNKLQLDLGSQSAVVLHLQEFSRGFAGFP